MSLLEETLEVLSDHGKSPKDIHWIGSRTHRVAWDQFEKIADTEYDGGYGSAKVAQDLLVVGKDWWLERGEYDGSEWWDFKQMPKEPTELLDLKALTVNQADDLGYDVSCGWEDLASINGIKDSN